MGIQNTLTQGEKNFFSLVFQAVLANPFSDEREAADLRITGLFPGVSRSEVLQQAIDEVRRKIIVLETEGRAHLNAYAEADRQVLTAAFLFDIFHGYIEKFDQLILDQIANDDRSLNVPFAKEAISLFRKRGFDNDTALHFFALCYQLRRAFYFIDRGLVGRSRCMRKLREDLWNNVFTYDMDLYNQYLWNRMEDFSTLILGETGTGKGAAAMAIGRSGYIPFDEKKGCFADSFTKTFIALNLSQFPENLIESELFGHKKGAFTGAVEDHTGVFDRCSPHGAIFLDEIGEVSKPVQIKLLKVLEERLFCPVGSHNEKRFQGRIIAATNRSLDKLRNASVMREDFFYRLCSDIIHVPPLRQRIAEDPGELDDLLAFTLHKITGKPSPDLNKTIRRAILEQPGKNYAWPGNVRELGQCVRRILLKKRYESTAETRQGTALSDLHRQMEIGAINVNSLVKAYCRQLYETFGNYGEVARRTGLDRRTVKKHVGAGGENDE